jgi:hypothetical protein
MQRIAAALFEQRRPHENIKRDHCRYWIPRQAEKRHTAHLTKCKRFAWAQVDPP